MHVLALLAWASSVAAGDPLSVVLPGPSDVLNPKPLPFALGPAHNPVTNETLDIDSRSMLLNGRRWYPVSGEIHMARVPAEQWRESLLRMRAGGLDSIAFYIFWIHHEEREGEFVFTGRRDLRRFLSIAQEVGLKVMLRVGPWGHGEARNGGHPDWVIAKSKAEGFALRQNNTQYVALVRKYYAAVAEQVRGLWWKDGGPVAFVQIDNETPDCTYLLELRQVAVDVGMTPFVFTKTGWPTPTKGYTPDIPLLPYFGAYPDLFWSNSMHPTPSSGNYMFSDAVDSNSTTPGLTVETGGGMTTAYNHRVNLDPSDMPSLHVARVGSGWNSLGYYMYHGGLNPPALYPAGNMTAYDPKATLQESSFQPAGAANPMPSTSYDFFAPLGDAGQPRPHFHQMRRLHNLARDFGDALADAVQPTLPAERPGGHGDSKTLRWIVRTAGAGSGFIFVNNDQRLQSMAAHDDVRFSLDMSKVTGGKGSLMIPSSGAAALSVADGDYFVWPFGLNVEFSRGPGVEVAWATAQPIALVDSGKEADGTTRSLVLIQTAPDPNTIEVAITAATGVSLTGLCSGCTQSAEKDGTGRDVLVVRGIEVDAWIDAPAFSVSAPDGTTLQVTVLPKKLEDSVWRGRFAGRERVFITGPGSGVETLVLSESGSAGNSRGESLSLRSDKPWVALWMLPSPDPKRRVIASSARVSQTPGYWPFFNVTFETKPAPVARTQLLRKAGPPRSIPSAPSKKAQEPTLEEWAAAAVYSVSLDPPTLPDNSTELRLRVLYNGDAARLYTTPKGAAVPSALLTDNWFSGYKTEGAMASGLSYIAAEHPQGAIFGPDANMTLAILPMQKSVLEKQVYLRDDVWPAFDADGIALGIEEIQVIQVFKSTIALE